MKLFVCLISVILGLGGFAADASWEYVYIVNNGLGRTIPFHTYDICGEVVADSGGASTEGPMMGYEDAEGFHLKQYDHKTTPMPVDNNVWVLACYGDLLVAETIEDSLLIPLTDYSDCSTSGGVLVENPSDFYLGFMATGSNAYDEIDRFGWYHVSIDENLEMVLLDAGVGLYGEPVLVGIGAIPEPSGALLLLVGLCCLGLRRRDPYFGIIYSHDFK